MHKNKKKSKAKQTCKFKNCLHLCAYHCAQLLYTIQHITVLIIFSSKSPNSHHSSDAVYWRGDGFGPRSQTEDPRCQATEL